MSSETTNGFESPDEFDFSEVRKLVAEVARINATLVAGARDADLVPAVVALVIGKFALLVEARADGVLPGELYSPRSWARRESRLQTAALSEDLKDLNPADRAARLAELFATNLQRNSTSAVNPFSNTGSKLHLLGDLSMEMCRIVSTRLDPMEERVLELVHRPGSTYEEVAEELGLSVREVKGTFFRVSRELTQLILAECEDPAASERIRGLVSDPFKTQNLIFKLFDVVRLV